MSGQVLHSAGITRGFFLREQLRRSIVAFYENRTSQNKIADANAPVVKEEKKKKEQEAYVHQCKHCLTIYDETVGEPGGGIEPGTVFESLDNSYTCAVCEAPKEDFIKTEKSKLGLQSV